MEQFRKKETWMEFVGKLVTKHLPPSVQRMTELLAKEEWQELRSLTHQVKGMTGMVGALRITRTCAALQDRCDEMLAAASAGERDAAATGIRANVLEAEADLGVLKEEYGQRVNGQCASTD